MVDIDEPEDIVDALDPGGIVERLVSSLMLVVAALLGVALTVVLVVSAVVLVALSAGLVAALATLVVLTLLCLFLLILGVGVLLSLRSGSSGAQERVLARADDTPQADGSMTEEEAVTELKSEYAEGNIDDEELDRALDDALTSERPERVVERYR